MRRLFLFVAVLVLALAARPVSGQVWSPIGPPGGGDVRALLLLPSNHTFVYAAAYGAGVFRTTDAGVTWTALNDGLTNLSVTALAGFQLPPTPGCPPPEECFPPDLYVGTTTGLFRSFGSAWSPVAGVPAVPIDSVSLSSSLSSASVWAGTEGAGLYHSADFGQTWAQVSSLPGTSVSKVVAYGAVVLAVASGGTYRSADGGATWSVVFPTTGGGFFFRTGFVAFDPVDPTIVYASGTSDCAPCGVPPTSALLKSTDGGVTWSFLNGSSGPIVVDSSHAVYVGSAGHFSRSLDGGSTWQELGVGLPERFTSDLVVLSGWYPPFSAYAAVQGLGVYFLRGCVAEPCLSSDRFDLEVSYSIRPGEPFRPAPAWLLTANTAAFSFFSRDNIDLVVKVLDGRSINGHFWVFYGSLTNVAFRLTVTDSQTGARKTYSNDYGQMTSVADTSAF